MSIKLKHSGGNSVSLNPPTSAPTSSEVAFKLPTSDGSAGQVLKTDGSGNLSWVNPGGLKMADMWRLTTTYNIPHNSTAVIATTNWERPDTANDGFGQLGTGMSVNASDHASGIWTFPSTGFYLVMVSGIIYNGQRDPRETFINIEFTENGADFGRQTRAFGGGRWLSYNPLCGQALVDVTSTSNVKMRLRIYSAEADSSIFGSSTENRTYISFYRLGDT